MDKTSCVRLGTHEVFPNHIWNTIPANAARPIKQTGCSFFSGENFTSAKMITARITAAKFNWKGIPSQGWPGESRAIYATWSSAAVINATDAARRP